MLIKNFKTYSEMIENGEEEYESFERKKGFIRIKYHFTFKDKTFSCIDSSLEKCRERRDFWLMRKIKQ